MTIALKDALLGGPGLDGYAYNADVLCVDCGHAAIEAVFDARRAMGQHELTDLEAGDSEVIPVPIFFGESDTAQHCGECGSYLYGERDYGCGADDELGAAEAWEGRS